MSSDICFVTSEPCVICEGKQKPDWSEPLYHSMRKVNIAYPEHMPSQIRWVAHSPNSNGVVLYYTHPQ